MQKYQDSLELTQNWLHQTHDVQITTGFLFPCKLMIIELLLMILLVPMIYINYLHIGEGLFLRSIVGGILLLVLSFTYSSIVDRNKLKLFKEPNPKSLQKLTEYYSALRQATQIKVFDKIISFEAIKDKNGPIQREFMDFEMFFVQFLPQITFANTQTKAKFYMIVDEQELINAELFSAADPLEWKKEQVYENMSTEKRKRIFWLYVILSLMCMSWMVEWYVNKKLSVFCKIWIKKQVYNPEILKQIK